ncbi:hypothetical protein ACFE04_020534 [Oxalis oulophora]
MNGSRPSVHPVEAPPPFTDAQNAGGGGGGPPRVRMKEIQGMGGTHGGLILRVTQFGFALISVSVMASTSDFHTATAFWGILCSSLEYPYNRIVLGFVDMSAIISTLTFASACASAGITVLIGNDLNKWVGVAQVLQDLCDMFSTLTECVESGIM